MIHPLITLAVLAAQPLASEPRPCEIRVNADKSMVPEQIEVAIKAKFDGAARVRVHFTGESGAGQLSARVWRSGDHWHVLFTDYDGLSEDHRVPRISLEVPENDVGHMIGRWARGACEGAPAVAVAPAPAPAPIFVAEPQPPVTPLVPPHQAPAPSGGQGLLATTLTLGFGGMALGVAGFAAAYHFERGYNGAKSRGDINQMLVTTKDTGLALGLGTAGAAMLGAALILIVPTSIRLTRRNAASRHRGGATLSPVIGPRSGLSLRF